LREATIIANVKIAVIDEDVIIRDFIVSTLMYSVNREILTFDDGFDAWVYFEESGPRSKKPARERLLCFSQIRREMKQRRRNRDLMHF
jgi:hypothetical protein